jgi:PhnB protein
MVSYEDVAAAIEWLVTAFGFREVGARFTDDEGRVTHAELDIDGAHVMLGWPGADYRSPGHHARTCADAARWLDVPWAVDGVLVTVPHLDAHHARSVSAGARILRGPEAVLSVGRLYAAEDLEGHRWMFMEEAAS